MAEDIKTEGAAKRMNDLVAVTVVVLTVFMAISKVKDDNINQAMQKAKSESVDAWAEYQSARIKLHVDENGLSTLRLIETGGQIDKALAAKQAAEYESDIRKYEGRSKETMAKAKALEAEYDRLNFRDDQFDMSDAFLSIAVALSAVASLVSACWLLYVAWGSGAFGLVMGIAGFLGYNLRPEWIATLLGT
ncbi:MAG: hypothetical protein QOI12_3273 [Alphaproteobacteria bacterium]|jgi:hypothetical protein|nr:hypothetical protein [Alphaproteobacteria bacterium]